MKSPAFDYVRPTSVAAALAVLANRAGDAKVIAGGQSLAPMLNFRLLAPALLIDINGIVELDYIRDDAGGGLRIGALTRHHRLMTATAVCDRFPVLAEAMRHVAHLAIRNRGTIGGSLCHADPAAELPMMAVLLDATLTLTGPSGVRRIAAADFFQGALTTALAQDELLTEVALPALPPRTGWGFHEFSRRAGDFALAAATATLTASDRRAADVRLAVTGIGETPLRLAAAEAALDGRPVDAASIADAVALVRAAIHPMDDLHGSADYRRHLVGGLVTRALEDAWRRARAQSGEPA
jgi:carbon-monoxide dehydrogenase medium subunit